MFSLWTFYCCIPKCFTHQFSSTNLNSPFGKEPITNIIGAYAERVSNENGKMSQDFATLNLSDKLILQTENHTQIQIANWKL